MQGCLWAPVALIDQRAGGFDIHRTVKRSFRAKNESFFEPSIFTSADCRLIEKGVH